LRQLSDTVSSEISETDSDLCSEAEDTLYESGHERLVRRMNEATHKNSFRILGIEHFECFKATSLWLNDLKVIEHSESSDEVILAH
jgi:hypothetical protein